MVLGHCHFGLCRLFNLKALDREVVSCLRAG
jgi:hypothetical protein